MNPQGQGQPGAGSALLRLMQLRAQGSTPGALNGNLQNSGAVLPAAPNQGNAINPSQLAQAGQQALQAPRIMGAPPQGDVAGAGAPQMPSGMAQPTPTTPDDNLSVALQALGNYIKAHGEAHMAKNGVPQAKAHASLISAQARPQGGE